MKHVGAQRTRKKSYGDSKVVRRQLSELRHKFPTLQVSWTVEVSKVRLTNENCPGFWPIEGTNFHENFYFLLAKSYVVARKYPSNWAPPRNRHGSCQLIDKNAKSKFVPPLAKSHVLTQNFLLAPFKD